MRAFLPVRFLSVALLQSTLALPALALSFQQQLALTLLPQEQTTVSDTSPDNAAPVVSDVVPLALQAFDADLGVLLSVSAQLRIDPNQGLMAYRNESGGSWDSIATLRAQLRMDSTVLAASGPSGLQRVVANRDTPVVVGTDWQSLDLLVTGGSALEAFAGNSLPALSVQTSLSALISGGGGGSTAIASVLSVEGNNPPGPDSDGLGATLSWRYDWLGHARVSFASDQWQASQRLQLTAGSDRTLTLHALDAGLRTAADLVRVDCSGDCASFSLELASFTALAAGQQLDAQLRALGGAGASATYTLWVRDNAGIGASSSQRSQALTLSVAISAVSEPSPWLLMLLALPTLMRRRRSA